MSFRTSVVRCFLAGVVISLITLNPAFSGELIGSEWRPTLIGKLSIPEKANIFVQFKTDGKILGSGGCNRFFGTYDITENKIKFSPFGATRMACEKSVMDLEMTFMMVFEEISAFEKDGINLTFFNTQGQPVIQLVQADRD